MRNTIRRDLVPHYQSFSYPVLSFDTFDGRGYELSMPLNKCYYGYNVRIEDGVIKQGYGVSNARLGESLFPNAATLASPIVNAGVYHRYDRENGLSDDMLVYLCKNRKVYYRRPTDSFFTYTGVQLDSLNATFLNYHDSDKDLFLMMTDSGTSYFFDGTNLFNFVSPKSVSACVHNTRVYSVDGNHRLSYSQSMHPANWSATATEGGYVDFPDEGGKLQGVISWKDSIFIFRDYGIYRLTAYVDPTDYTLNKVYVGEKRIIFPTARIVGDQIVFVAEDGFYSLDGYNVKRIYGGLFAYLDGVRDSVGYSFGEKYYLATRLKRDDAVVGDEVRESDARNGVIVVDLDRKDISITRGVNVSKFFRYDLGGYNKLVFLFGSTYRGMNVGEFTDDGRLFNEALLKVWHSPYTDLSSMDKTKVLKRFFVRTMGDITLTIRADKDYPVPLIGEVRTKIIPVNRHAERIGFSLTTSADSMEVSGIYIEMDFVRRPHG